MPFGDAPTPTSVAGGLSETAVLLLWDSPTVRFLWPAAGFPPEKTSTCCRPPTTAISASMKLSALVALQLAAGAFAFCPHARAQPRALSPSPLAHQRVLAAEMNGIKITSVNSAAARAAARREANELQNPAPPPVLQPPPVPQAQEATGSVAQGGMGIEPVMGLPQAPVAQVTLTLTLTLTKP